MNKIELIRAEIERRKKENMYNALPITIGRYYEDRDLLFFIDSLPNDKSEKPIFLSEDLETAAQHSAMLTYKMPEGDWEKANKTLEARIFHEIGFKAGAQWQKEEMLNGAIEFVAQGDTSLKQGELCFVAYHLCLPPKHGDKVKVIIVKEDEK